MNENRLHEVLILFLLTVFVLFLLSVIPPFTVGSFSFQRIDLLSDVKPETPPLATADSAAEEEVIAPPVQTGARPCPQGMTCIEDFSADGTAMAAYLQALETASETPLRIAFFGDSFIEGDILTASLRDTLQSLYGGSGPGLVPITSEVSKFRNSIKHAFTGWKSFTIVGNYDEEDRPVFGPLGSSAVPMEGNAVEYRPGKGSWKLEPAQLLYSSSAVRRLRITLDDSTVSEQMLPISSGMSLQRLSTRPVRFLKLEIMPPDSIQLFGVDFRQGAGITVDNLAMRGNSGLALTKIPGSFLREYNRFGGCRLVILQFGLNVVSETDKSDYSWYASGMVRVVNQMKEQFPESSILILSVSDRSSNQDGSYKTMPGILAMRKAQRRVASETGVAFWDMFQAMGGENSMPGLVNSTPPMAGKDYTHLNFRGGQMLAYKLTQALEFERTRHEQP